MTQVPKDRVRQAFVAAAASAFAELGYAATTMADVAERAASSVGNLYRYFSSKQQLFEAAVPRTFVSELRRRTRARVQALGSARDVRELSTDAAYHTVAGELLDFCLANRSAVVIVLLRAEGTPFAAFRGGFVAELVGWALDYARGPYPALQPSAELLFVLRHAYESFVTAVAEALRELPDEAQTRAVVALLTAQHQAGLKRLFEIQGGMDAQSPNSRESTLVASPAGAHARNAPARRAGSGATGPRARQADRARRPGRRR